MHAPSTTFVLELREGRGSPLAMELHAGETRAPFAIGLEGAWIIDAAGVRPVHGYLYFDGAALFAQSSDFAVPLFLDGKPVPTAWTPVHAPASFTLGEATIVVRAPHETFEDQTDVGPDTERTDDERTLVQPSPLLTSTLPETGRLARPARAPVPAPVAAPAPPPQHRPPLDTGPTLVRARPASAPPPGAPMASPVPQRLAPGAVEAPPFAVPVAVPHFASPRPAAGRPASIPPPRGASPAAAPAPFPPPPAGGLAGLGATLPMDGPPTTQRLVEPEPPPWPPPAPMAAPAQHAPMASPARYAERATPAPAPYFKPIGGADPDEATVFAPLDGSARAAGGLARQSVAPPGPVFAPPATAPATPPRAPGRIATFWREAPLPRKIMLLLFPIVLVAAAFALRE